jgi:hypothetical protein
MLMPDFLYTLSDLTIFLILVGITISVSIVAVLIDKHFIFHKLRYKDNPTIGSISSLIGIIYGVLVGFIAFYLITNQDHATDAAQREASAAATIYEGANWLPPAFQTTVQKDITDYINTVIKVEWPLMRQFKDIGIQGDLKIEKVLNDLKSYVPINNSETINLQNLLSAVNTLYTARHARIGISSSSLSPELWEVIMIGTILIIAINYAFRVNFSLHLFATCSFAIMAASMLFLLVTLDRPFQGEFAVNPDAFDQVMDLIDAKRQ